MDIYARSRLERVINFVVGTRNWRMIECSAVHCTTIWTKSFESSSFSCSSQPQQYHCPTKTSSRMSYSTKSAIQRPSEKNPISFPIQRRNDRPYCPSKANPTTHHPKMHPQQDHPSAPPTTPSSSAQVSVSHPQSPGPVSSAQPQHPWFSVPRWRSCL